MTHEELQLAVYVAQACLGDDGFEAIVVEDDPMMFTIMVGGEMDDVMFTTSDSTSHFAIQATGSDKRASYIHHIITTIKRARTAVRAAVLEYYLDADEQ